MHRVRAMRTKDWKIPNRVAQKLRSGCEAESESMVGRVRKTGSVGSTGAKGDIASPEGLQNLLYTPFLGFKPHQNQQRPGSWQRSLIPTSWWGGAGCPSPKTHLPLQPPSGLKLRPFGPLRPPRPFSQSLWMDAPPVNMYIKQLVRARSSV